MGLMSEHAMHFTPRSTGSTCWDADAYASISAFAYGTKEPVREDLEMLESTLMLAQDVPTTVVIRDVQVLKA